MPTILLVRHGQASFGTDNYDRLSDVGHQQAKIVAAALTERGADTRRVVSGTLLRQRDTATPLAQRLGVTLESDARWNEYAMDDIVAAHGAATARVEATPGQAPMSSAAFQEVLDDGLRRWIGSGPATSAQETWPAFRDRTGKALDELAGSLGSGQTAVAFTSGGVIAALCARLLDGTPEQLLHFNRVVVNTGITKIAAGRRGLTLIGFNDHAHLERPGASLITYR